LPSAHPYTKVLQNKEHIKRGTDYVANHQTDGFAEY
jgi:hypothetical protein